MKKNITILLGLIFMLFGMSYAIPSDPMILSGNISLNDETNLNGSLEYFVGGVSQGTIDIINGGYGLGFEKVVLTGENGDVVTFKFTVSGYNITDSTFNYNVSTVLDNSLILVGSEVVEVVADSNVEDSPSDESSGGSSGGSSSYNGSNSELNETNSTLVGNITVDLNVTDVNLTVGLNVTDVNLTVDLNESNINSTLNISGENNSSEEKGFPLKTIIATILILLALFGSLSYYKRRV